MGERTVRSPWSTDKSQPHPLRGASPGAYSSPSNAPRPDSNHLVRSPGKGPAVRRDGAVPVVGNGSAAEIERALERGLNRGDRR
jgi:hypothetical protein